VRDFTHHCGKGLGERRGGGKRATNGAVAILGLADTPSPVGCLKMSGSHDHWRIRVGDWRVVYRIEDARLVVMGIAVAPRGGVFR
jgi:mRNA-degrading endonuclease RelE of RelBE toxin-antitoxin system